jgi:MauM/NapG family ferredoxin protein
VCPTQAITFGWRGAGPPSQEGQHSQALLSRRGFLAATALGSGAAFATRLATPPVERPAPIRPPGSLPEPEFLATCIRCSQCVQACPNSVLRPVGFAHGVEGLWTPVAVPDWSGCDPSCNNCGRVCPTGAIRALPLLEKRAVRMGLATVDHTTCLPWKGAGACELCADECRAAGYEAIEFERVGVVVDEEGLPTEGSGFRAPVLLPERCVGCGLCQTRCHRVNVLAQRVLCQSAIRVSAGPGREDRMARGSYLALREAERRLRLSGAR